MVAMTPASSDVAVCANVWAGCIKHMRAPGTSKLMIQHCTPINAVLNFDCG
jgi:hypothetical protein